MSHTIFARLLILLLINNLASCTSEKKFDSEFQWLNESSDTIWVAEVSGFKIDPMPGILSGPSLGGGASLVLPDQAFPLETTITWWFGDRAAKETAEIHKSTVHISEIPNVESQQVLIFTFGKDHEWTTHWETSKF